MGVSTRGRSGDFRVRRQDLDLQLVNFTRTHVALMFKCPANMLHIPDVFFVTKGLMLSETSG